MKLRSLRKLTSYNPGFSHASRCRKFANEIHTGWENHPLCSSKSFQSSINISYNYHAFWTVLYCCCKSATENSSHRHQWKLWHSLSFAVGKWGRWERQGRWCPKFVWRTGWSKTYPCKRGSGKGVWVEDFLQSAVYVKIIKAKSLATWKVPKMAKSRSVSHLLSCCNKISGSWQTGYLRNPMCLTTGQFSFLIVFVSGSNPGVHVASSKYMICKSNRGLSSEFSEEISVNPACVSFLATTSVITACKAESFKIIEKMSFRFKTCICGEMFFSAKILSIKAINAFSDVTDWLEASLSL